MHEKNEVSPRHRSFSTAVWLTFETGCAAEIGDDMLMGNPNLHEDDEEEGEADEDDKQDPTDAQAEEAEMDNVEALMAGVAIEEKDKVSPGVGYNCDFD